MIVSEFADGVYYLPAANNAVVPPPQLDYFYGHKAHEERTQKPYRVHDAENALAE